eukprot:scaffold176966_cov26-Tisochrysis_lutea.AAC.8
MVRLHLRFDHFVHLIREISRLKLLFLRELTLSQGEHAIALKQLLVAHGRELGVAADEMKADQLEKRRRAQRDRVRLFESRERRIPLASRRCRLRRCQQSIVDSLPLSARGEGAGARPRIDQLFCLVV